MLVNESKRKVMTSSKSGDASGIIVCLHGELMEEDDSFTYQGSHVGKKVGLETEVRYEVKARCWGTEGK